jgi:hypothetical protein
VIHARACEVIDRIRTWTEGRRKRTVPEIDAVDNSAISIAVERDAEFPRLAFAGASRLTGTDDRQHRLHTLLTVLQTVALDNWLL